MQRPQEALTAHAVDATIRTLGAVHGPATGLPMQLAVTTGDAIDNAQWNELQAFLALFDGGLVSPDSGGPDYEGVQAPDWPGDIFWRPDGPGAEGPDFFRREFGFPHHPGLLQRALREFSATGLSIPWLSCFGNHEALNQGVGTQTPGAGRRDDRRQEADRPARGLRPRPGAREVHRASRGVHGRPVPPCHARSVPSADHQAGLRRCSPAGRLTAVRARLYRTEPAGRHRLLRPRHPRGALHRAGHELPGRRRVRVPGRPAGALAGDPAGGGAFGLPRGRTAARSGPGTTTGW